MDEQVIEVELTDAQGFEVFGTSYQDLLKHRIPIRGEWHVVALNHNRNTTVVRWEPLVET